MFLIPEKHFTQELDNQYYSDSTRIVLLKIYKKELSEIKQRKLEDSVLETILMERILTLELDSNQAKVSEDNNQVIPDPIKSVEVENSEPVIGLSGDTLFYFYYPVGTLKADQRAKNLSEKLKELFNQDEFTPDSLKTITEDNTVEIYYQDQHLLTATKEEAEYNQLSLNELSKFYLLELKQDLEKSYRDKSFLINLLKAGKVLIILIGLWLLIRLISAGSNRSFALVEKHKDKWLKDLQYKNYTFLSKSQEITLIKFLIGVAKWVLIILSLYISIPLIFSVFTFTRGWADKLFKLVWTPFSSMATSIWSFLPNLITIIAILLVMHYFLKFIKYIFQEIRREKLTIPGFYPDWAKPTYGIVKFLLLAFTVILIFPYLPGSDSKIFQGVSVFVGVLFSLGSTNAISNMVAGIVITYMRPFKRGDRVRIGSITGDIIEKNLLVTRINSIKNEVITIPNSTILSGNILNYNLLGSESGLIIYTTVTIGYDVPWKKVHQALKEAAGRTELLLDEPEPYVFQTELSDFYVAYQLNAYTKEPNKQAAIYSALHAHIQDVFNENDIEIMSPHYQANRDGNKSTIPKINSGKSTVKKMKMGNQSEGEEPVLGDRGQAIEEDIEDVTKNSDVTEDKSSKNPEIEGHRENQNKEKKNQDDDKVDENDNQKPKK
ncbi:mechanosensitive ion channel family protein [Mangrovivirga sp. M17]|uniref:Mechanosensitive ion channel family protein n=1 Tax=Mangrovivirga halotolerans TaxID=2993936 RepID=A0ABT3RMJ2_9BACT|nr:mechanosensitive ion channel family protein [Mangrovivirga halotolerans]MCX2742785.1 mechanosensitive ion channel family protein [Mangrovivirga halotolerans]